MKFGQRPCTIVQGLWPDFFSNFKNFTVKILSTMSKGNPDVHVYSHS